MSAVINNSTGTFSNVQLVMSATSINVQHQVQKNRIERIFSRILSLKSFLSFSEAVDIENIT
jgi:hypothetical protein